MDKDVSTIYAIITGIFGFLFGVTVGVVLCSIAGALLSLRFSDTKSTFDRLKHVAYSVIISCIIVGELYQPEKIGELPNWIESHLTPKIFAGLLSFLFLLIAEKLYNMVKSVDLTEEVKIFITKWREKWTPKP